MRMLLVLLVVGVIWLPVVADAETIQQPDQERVRSTGRTWTGVSLLAGGGVMAAYYGASSCATERVFGVLLDVRPCSQAAALIWTGIGMATAGALLATVWSDVPVVRNLTVAPTRGGVQVGAAFGF